MRQPGFVERNEKQMMQYYITLNGCMSRSGHYRYVQPWFVALK